MTSRGDTVTPDLPPDSVYDPSPRERLDMDSFDPERLRGLIEHGLANLSIDRRVDRFLRAGAEFIAKPLDDATVEIVLAYSRERSPALAVHRAAIRGDEPGVLGSSEYEQIVPIISAPLSALKRVTQDWQHQ
jgi:hypothetical protein